MEHTNHNPEVGSISSDTLRTPDLIDAFDDHLAYLSPKQWRKVRRDFKALYRDNQSWEDTCEQFPEESEFLLERLQDELGDLAPWGLWFGASEGDGACFGYWVSNDAIESGDVPKVDDTGQAPKDCCAVLCVSDHGNIEYYERRTPRSRWHSIWSCV